MERWRRRSAKKVCAGLTSLRCNYDSQETKAHVSSGGRGVNKQTRTHKQTRALINLLYFSITETMWEFIPPLSCLPLLSLLTVGGAELQWACDLLLLCCRRRIRGVLAAESIWPPPQPRTSSACVRVHVRKMKNTKHKQKRKCICRNSSETVNSLCQSLQASS